MEKFNIYVVFDGLPTTQIVTRESVIASEIADALFADYPMIESGLAASIGSAEDAFQVRQNKNIPIGHLELDDVSADAWVNQHAHIVQQLSQLTGPMSCLQDEYRDCLKNLYKFELTKPTITQ